MNQDMDSVVLPHQICELWYDLKVVDIAYSESPDDEKDDRPDLLEQHIQNRAVIVVGSDYLYNRERTNFRKAILYRSDITTFDGKLAWQDYSSTTMDEGLFFGSKPSVFTYKGTFVS